ncbi:hypothetical protein EDD93_3180 [Streptomyces sp. 840.1]|uniref:hypothetical protein n=1 Tax=Streptomyces sp. 840.1 TaxID=2485152 RepID=UPI000F4968CB|nr:hypothetical protein [Streptomyces sp. 840.1]ROQ68704.1 hypothetical protein EDD93_3180 [Streptomyces sp. 840.1]
MTAVERLWAGHGLPVADALHDAEGRSDGVALDVTAPSGFSVLSPFDRIRVSGRVAAFHSTAEFDITADVGDPRTPVREVRPRGPVRT